MSPWCKARVPLVYNYLQSHYWGVGFLRYFQLKQLPNFLLASPILSLALCSIIHYMRLQPEIFFSLGFRASPEEKNSAAVLFSLGADKRSNSDQFSKKSIPQTQENHNLRRRKQLQGEESAASPTGCKSSARLGYLSAFVLPFVLHLGFMAATAFFVMHVQVSTRFLSASPPLYWFASYLMVSPGAGRRWGYLIWAYSAAYILLGSLLFSNFYPFTWEAPASIFSSSKQNIPIADLVLTMFPSPVWLYVLLLHRINLKIFVLLSLRYLYHCHWSWHFADLV